MSGPDGYAVLTHPATMACFAAIGLFWGIAYVLILRRGYRDRTFAMPVVACCLNISWEAVVSWVFPFPGATVLVGVLWFLLDVGIFAQIVLYGRRDLRLTHLSPVAFGVGLAGVMALSFAAVFVLNVDPELSGGARYAALGVPLGHVFVSFGQNVVMSASYVAMLLRRDSVAGQSVYIALSKGLGTLLAMVGMVLWFPFSLVLTWCFAAILVLDVAYGVLVVRKCRAQGLDPWRRW